MVGFRNRADCFRVIEIAVCESVPRNPVIDVTLAIVCDYFRRTERDTFNLRSGRSGFSVTVPYSEAIIRLSSVSRVE